MKIEVTVIDRVIELDVVAATPGRHWEIRSLKYPFIYSIGSTLIEAVANALQGDGILKVPHPLTVHKDWLKSNENRV